MRDIQRQIDLISGSSLPDKPMHPKSPKEHEELQRQVEEALVKGLIRVSMSPCVIPAMLTPKKDGSWRACVDSRAINKITIEYRYPISHLDDMLDYLVGAKVYSKIDIRSGFGTSMVMFRGFVIPAKGIKVDEPKVEAVVEWPTPRFIHDVQSFHGLYWTPEANESFQLIIKRKIFEASIVALPNFGKTFEIDCDASKVGIGVILSREGHLVAFFSEKLSGSMLNYTTYDVEFYAIVQALRHWLHYLVQRDFILNSDHEALKYINNHKKLSLRHANTTTMETFS
ncbi:transposon ty3-I gag-pol polyprotein [Tanacetum coccineum]